MATIRSLKNSLSLILVLAISTLFAQEEKATDRRVGADFERRFNAGQYDSLFALFSPEMKRAVPADKAADFFTGLKAQAGNILARVFTKYEASYATYKTSFERGVFAVKLSVDQSGQINGLSVRPFTADSLPQMARNRTRLRLPVDGLWTVVWGGDTKELNYHVESQAQKNAFDLVIRDESGASYKTDGRQNDDYYAFEKELYAPCDGEVVPAVDGVKDNRPGELNPLYVPGNTVIIKTGNHEYLFFAHLKQRSLKVAEGDRVKRGQVSGLCGNSGHSSEPHLHFHVQNAEDANVATGVKCYFDCLRVKGTLRTDYSHVRNERVKNEKR